MFPTPSIHYVLNELAVSLSKELPKKESKSSIPTTGTEKDKSLEVFGKSIEQLNNSFISNLQSSTDKNDISKNIKEIEYQLKTISSQLGEIEGDSKVNTLKNSVAKFIEKTSLVNHLLKFNKNYKQIDAQLNTALEKMNNHSWSLGESISTEHYAEVLDLFHHLHQLYVQHGNFDKGYQTAHEYMDEIFKKILYQVEGCLGTLLFDP